MTTHRPNVHRMNRWIGLPFLLVVAAALNVGCATHSRETATREQQASIDLQRAGARQASGAAQDRSDRARSSGSCDGLLDCLITGLLQGEVSPKSGR
ncbi:hypothetical protein ACQ86G_20075 [Roseateles chitinivorans]|uniref:hypothetical protein n=1 Tax=Roseateles chitinivorans TaxID=2917965 RepID=UPI003D67A533